MTRTLLGVAGWPVGHSRSPGMHSAALAELGLDWLYLPLGLPPAQVQATIPALEAAGFRGINVTVPHKLVAHALADQHSPAAAAIGAANTLSFRDGRIHADNTDAGGFLDALAEDPCGWKALVLGAGGSARAVAWALREAGAEVAVWNRTAQRAHQLASELEVAHAARVESCDLLVNCTSVGLDPALAEGEAIAALGLDGIEPPATVADLVYGVGPTPVARWAGRGGARVVEGQEVLLHQGARSLAVWTGREPPLEVMRRSL